VTWSWVFTFSFPLDL